MPEGRFYRVSPKHSIAGAAIGLSINASPEKRTNTMPCVGKSCAGGRDFSRPEDAGIRRFLRQTTYCCAAPQNLFSIPERTERNTGREKKSHALHSYAVRLRWQRAGLSTRFEAL